MQENLEQQAKISSVHGAEPEWKQKFWEGIKLFVVPIIIVLCIRIYIVQPFIVKGASMEPNFEDQEYLIVDEITPALHGLTRGEVIIFHYPLDPSEYFIKRVIGLPGETVSIHNGDVSVTTTDGKVISLSEDYLARGTVTTGDMDVKVPDKNYFVLGDNRNFSSDSRRWGLLPQGLVTGRALLRLWPPEKLGIIYEASYKY